MSDVAVKLKVMPTSPEIDLDELESALEASLPDAAEIRAFERENVAFGLVALLSSVVIPDDVGGTDAVEEAFAGVADVESVEVLNVGLL